MVEQRFWGIVLRTRRQRRLMAGMYCLLASACAGILLWLGPKSYGSMIDVGFLFVIVLGGVRNGGVVKVYEEPKTPLGRLDGTQTLNLEGLHDTTGRKGNGPWDPLDERERTERDRAHYKAYRILRWTLLAAALVLFGFSMNSMYPNVAREMPALLWILVVYVWLLPQLVVLWTEPEGPAEELALRG